VFTLDREKALTVYLKVMNAYETLTLECIDLSETIDTHGISPLYELHINGTDSNKLKQVVEDIQSYDVLITQKANDIYVI
jgi:hypothetical protein